MLGRGKLSQREVPRQRSGEWGAKRGPSQSQSSGRLSRVGSTSKIRGHGAGLSISDQIMRRIILLVPAIFLLYTLKPFLSVLLFPVSPIPRQGGALDGSDRTLSFQVCNGMSNQRLSMLYGFILASELGRKPILPDILLSGVQWSNKASVAEANDTNAVPFSTLYDAKFFKKKLEAVGISVVDPHERPTEGEVTFVDINKMSDPAEELASYHTTMHLAIGCPLFKLPSFYFNGANARIMWATLDGIKPNREMVKPINAIVSKMKSASSDGRYNFVHLRIEDDWLLHCKRWEHIRDGHIRNNCNNNSETIDSVLRNLKVSNRDPVYIASFWEQVNPSLIDTVMTRMSESGYVVFTSKDFKLQLSRDREVNALIDYEVSLQSYKLVGNSVSTFTTLSIFQRRHHGLWSSYYNGGNIPMSDFLPMENLPWVFTYSSDTPEWDYLVKAAVKSATRHHTIKPLCIFFGNTSSAIAQWLTEHDVTFIFHKPAWADGMWKKLVPDKPPPPVNKKGKANVNVEAYGTNDAFVEELDDENEAPPPPELSVYGTRQAMENMFVRMDLPIIPELEQYIYILFTEPDVYFHKKMTVSVFSLPLPRVFGLAADPTGQSGVDGGVMLVNLPAARQSYEKFKDFVLSKKNGPIFKKSPGIVGAYLEFYKDTITQDCIPQSFAAKPFKENDGSAAVVHFQGPKPHEYWEYFLTMNCPRNQSNLCQQGFKNGLCYYTKKWKAFVSTNETLLGAQVWHACTSLYAKHMEGLCQERAAAAEAHKAKLAEAGGGAAGGAAGGRKHL